MAKSIDFAGRVAEVRKSVTAIQTRLRVSVNAPVPEETALQRIDDMVDAIAGEFRFIPEDFTQKDRPRPQWHLEADPLQVLAWVAPGLLKERMKAEVRDWYEAHSHAAFSDPTLASAIQADEKALFDAQVEEERLIHLAEEAGIQIPRRGDADPRAVIHAYTE